MELFSQNLNLESVADLMKIQHHYNDLSDDQMAEMIRLEQSYNRITEMPSDGLNPFYYHIYQNSLPPE